MGGYHCREKAGISCSTPSKMCGSWFCLGSSLRGVFLYSPGDVPGFNIHYGQTSQFDGMTHGAGMDINGGGGPKMFLVFVPKYPNSSPLYSIVHPGWSY